MPRKKWLIIAAAVLVLGGLGVGLVLLLVFGVFAEGGKLTVAGLHLPIYQLDQTASVHPGYRHTTLTCGNEVYVNDYEEASLKLTTSEPNPAIGTYTIGLGKVCAVPGQPTTAYIAGDVGSEMPAYVPFRASRTPPFDWRTAHFRELTADRPGSRNQYLTTTNSALLTEVVRTLRDDAPVRLPPFSFTNITSIPSLALSSDELPGMLFCPSVYFTTNGSIYLAESLMLDTSVTPPQLQARWIPASQPLTLWLKSP